jgi:hypothetical protein
LVARAAVAQATRLQALQPLQTPVQVAVGHRSRRQQTLRPVAVERLAVLLMPSSHLLQQLIAMPLVLLERPALPERAALQVVLVARASLSSKNFINNGGPNMEELLLKNLIEKLHGLKSPLAGGDEPKDGKGLEIMKVKALGGAGEDKPDDALSALLGNAGDEDSEEHENGHLSFSPEGEDAASCDDQGDDLVDLIKRLKG